MQDDGRGFDPALRGGTTHGLMGMRYRVESEGGQLRVRSAPGAGTTLEAWLPLLADDAPADDGVHTAQRDADLAARGQGDPAVG
jgi:signal transduction histidine kinase